MNKKHGNNIVISKNDILYNQQLMLDTGCCTDT